MASPSARDRKVPLNNRQLQSGRIDHDFAGHEAKKESWFGSRRESRLVWFAHGETHSRASVLCISCYRRYSGRRKLPWGRATCSPPISGRVASSTQLWPLGKWCLSWRVGRPCARAYNIDRLVYLPIMSRMNIRKFSYLLETHIIGIYPEVVLAWKRYRYYCHNHV